MKMHVARTPISPFEPFELTDVKSHIRVSDASEDTAVQSIAWTAALEVEQFAQIALLDQTITVSIFDPNRDPGLALPIGPAADQVVPTITIDGADFTAFDFVGGIRPYVRWLDDYFKLCPRLMTVEYQAGFGPNVTSIPKDLMQALMDQAALHYDGRSPIDTKSLSASPHMARIAARYRGLQL